MSGVRPFLHFSQTRTKSGSERPKERFHAGKEHGVGAPLLHSSTLFYPVMEYIVVVVKSHSAVSECVTLSTETLYKTRLASSAHLCSDDHPISSRWPS
jgi:hypothetical protein